METLKISKAEQKRRQDAFNYLDAALRKRLIDFENKYLEHAATWSIIKLEDEVKRLEKVIEKAVKESTVPRERNCGLLNNERSLKMVKETLSRKAIVQMKAFNEAKENYDEKITKLTNLLVEEGFSHLFFQIEEFHKLGSELEFLISNKTKEVHARLIFAHGPIKAPHFRFITTVRQK